MQLRPSLRVAAGAKRSPPFSQRPITTQNRLLTYLDLACALAAAALWYSSSSPWPLPLGVALLPWALRWTLTGRPSRRTPLDGPVALFLVTALLAVWVAFDRSAALARFWLLLGAVLLYYALANAQAAGSLRFWLLSLLGAGVSAAFILTHDWAAAAKIGPLTRLGLALQQALPRLPTLDANANIGGAILAALLPFAAWTCLQAWRAVRRASGSGLALAVAALLLAGLLLSVSALGLLLTASRAAWASLAGALALAALYGLTGRLSRGHHARHGLYLGLILALGLAALVALILTRPAWVAALLDALPGPAAVGARTDLWRGALTLVRDYPFTGLGHDGFTMAYSSYVMQLHVGFAPHAHNLYLDLAVEQGLPALLLFLLCCALFFVRFWHGADPDPSRPTARAEAGVAALSLLAILLHGLVDDPLYTSRAAVFLLIPLAFIPPAAPAQGHRPSRRSLVAVAVFLTLLLAVGFALRLPLLSVAYANLGAVRQTRAELSRYSWPEWPIQDELRRNVDLTPAISAYQRALALHPLNSTANRRLGQIELSLGQYGPALTHLQAAYGVEASVNTTRQLLGEAYLANGDLLRGAALWSGVANDVGQLQGRIWWYEHIGLKTVAGWMTEALP